MFRAAAVALLPLILACAAEAPESPKPVDGPTGQMIEVEGIGIVELVRGGKPLWIGRTEITNEQYERFYPKHERCPHSPGDRHPLVHVSWQEAVRFCERLTKELEHGVFRLPNEDEWEFACRAGSTTVYSFGDDTGKLEEHAWFAGESAKAAGDVVLGRNPSSGVFFNDGTDPAWLWYERETEVTAHEVGTRKQNAWFLHDMHGNAAEWCLDRREGPVDLVQTVTSSAIVTRPEWKSPDDPRIVRGGSYADTPGEELNLLASGARALRDASWGAGFRVVWVPPADDRRD